MHRGRGRAGMQTRGPLPPSPQPGCSERMGGRHDASELGGAHFRLDPGSLQPAKHQADLMDACWDLSLIHPISCQILAKHKRDRFGAPGAAPPVHGCHEELT